MYVDLLIIPTHQVHKLFKKTQLQTSLLNIKKYFSKVSKVHGVVS